MINRISEIPFWGPEEQIRRFINQHDEHITPPDTQQTITQQRIENLGEIYQRQLIWSYDIQNADDAYFYQDWCPIGEHAEGTSYNPNPKWQMDLWGEAAENIRRSMDRTFKYTDFKGYQKSELRGDEMLSEYDAAQDVHAKEGGGTDITNLDPNTLRHNIMWSYLEVSEWLGEGALEYGSHNGYVSRKMSLAWLFNAIKALINWKMNNQDKWAQEDIHPLMVNGTGNLSNVKERFLMAGESSTMGIQYDDHIDLDQRSGNCATQLSQRASHPDTNGTLKVRGNEWHYGERAYFYTHNSFIGECRFFHNARFLGQTTFDKEIAGTVMRSRWSDLAEYRESDANYPPGTLVMFGGEKEVTLSDGNTCHAIVTTKPGLVLNSSLEKGDGKTMVGLALVGKVPVKVEGDVKKFDKLVPSKRHKGLARRKNWFDFFKRPIGIALSDAKDGKVDCMTKMEF